MSDTESETPATTIPVLDVPAERPTPRLKERVTKRSYAKGASHWATRKKAEREATKAPQMGVGAASKDPDAKAAPLRVDHGDMPLRRVTRDERDVDRFSVPRHRLRRDWDVQWITISVINQPVDASSLREAYDGGWRPEKAKDWPELVLPGTPLDAAVEQYGQRLYGRPKSFTIAAREEDYRFATRQLSDRARSAAEGKVRGGDGLADISHVRPIPMGLTIEGEVGSNG